MEAVFSRMGRMLDYVWEADGTSRCLIPRNMGRQQICKLLCVHGSSRAWSNNFNFKKRSTEDINDSGDAGDQDLDKCDEELDC